jgi:hypothetical protein
MKIYNQNKEIVEAPKSIRLVYWWNKINGMQIVHNIVSGRKLLTESPDRIKEIHYVSTMEYDGIRYDLIKIIFHDSKTFGLEEMFLGHFNSGIYDPLTVLSNS